MLSTIHTITGVAIASYTRNPVWILLFGVGAHFLEDALPHWDDILPENLRGFFKPSWIWLDLAGSALAVFLLPYLLGVAWPQAWLYWFGGFAAMLPDGLIFLGKFLRFNPFNWYGCYSRFHCAVQWRVPLAPGLLFQVAVLVIMAYLIRIAHV